MKDSHLKTNKDGKKTLIVYYDNALANLDEMTPKALTKHGLPENNKLNIICLPDHSNQV